MKIPLTEMGLSAKLWLNKTKSWSATRSRCFSLKDQLTRRAKRQSYRFTSRILDVLVQREMESGLSL